MALEAAAESAEPEAILRFVDAANAAGLAGHGPVVLVGDAGRLERALATRGGPAAGVSVVAAQGAIGRHEHPARAARTRPGSATHVGFELLRDGRAAAFVGTGNAVAAMAVGVLTVRRTSGCDRPASTAFLPTRKAPALVLDVGANLECRASHLAQFATMGAAYVLSVLRRSQATVGLLSLTGEPTRSPELVREAHRLLCVTDLRYAGVVDAQAVLAGEVDVVVADGAVGGLAIQLVSAASRALLEAGREASRSSTRARLGGWCLEPALASLARKLDLDATHAAPLLGLDRVALAVPPEADAVSLVSAIRAARAAVDADLPAVLSTALERLGLLPDAVDTAELPVAREPTPSPLLPGRA